MTRDELEYSISQYLDGTLAADEEATLETRLSTDADARALLSEYRSLDRVLRAAPMPSFDFEALGDRIHEAVAAAEVEPAPSYRLPWVRTIAGLALAACVVIAAGVGIRRLQSSAAPGDNRIARTSEMQPTREPKQIVVVDATRRTAPSAAPVAVIAVGPATAAPDRPAFARYHEDLLSRPSQVMIARGDYSAQDGSAQDGVLLSP